MGWSKPLLTSVTAFKIWSLVPRREKIDPPLDKEAEHPPSTTWSQTVLATVWVTQSRVVIRTPSNCRDKSNPLFSIFYTKPAVRTLLGWLFMLSTYSDLRGRQWCQYQGISAQPEGVWSSSLASMKNKNISYYLTD